MITDIYLTYASWEELPSDHQAFFMQLMDNQFQKGHSLFALFYYWYNVVHEMGHVLRRVSGLAAASRWVEENAVSEFAVAYWREFGETARLAELQECLDDSLRLLRSPLPVGADPAMYFEENYTQLLGSLSEYTYLQFRWVLDALGKNGNLATALPTLISPAARPAGPFEPRFYPEISVDLPTLIIPDMRVFLAEYGVVVPPVQIVRGYTPTIQSVSFS